MNDNASGSSAVLEAALRLAQNPPGDHPIRFAFWGAEERGLLGSRHHLNSLPQEELRRIGLYVNLDMVGSINPARFIQTTQEPNGIAARIVTALKGFFSAQNLPIEERAGRRRGFGSDDAAFASKEIPTIGLYTGAGEPKSEALAAKFGGAAGEPFDPCYHKACDTASNVSREVLHQMTGALIHALSRVVAPDPNPG
jgi:Zn-dependent M28 family amino/carboxypeptidase